ncbi:oxidoreductase [Pseudonocardia sp. TMWB2A]|uniref:NAD-dependent epimerase/dehydratase family protein n=1 Tax=Pseudonocardia sp. TMWB2A TaxID=687430 RepID=UPI00307DFBBA
MRFLILGGTVFLGHAIAARARDRHHHVTCAARGSAPVPQGCDFVSMDRDDRDGLSPLTEHTWDVVVDVSRTPRHVMRAVRSLRGRHWVYVSSGNVYAHHDQREPAETAQLLPPVDDLDDPHDYDYGRAKVTCENLVRENARSATVVRSGLIGGHGDWSARSGYYPWRFAYPTGQDVLVPDAPDFPVAMIDVEDLADWIVQAAENSLDGVFNATGPTITLAQFLHTSRVAADSSAETRPVSRTDLARHGITAWSGECSLPLWIDDPGWWWFATLDTRAARAAGLVTRPLEHTLVAALAYEDDRRRHGGGPGPLGAGLSDDDERRLRSALT